MIFRKHYTLTEARRMLPRVKQWLQRLEELRAQHLKLEESLASLRANHEDLGGPVANSSVKTVADMQDVLSEFRQSEIQLKDLERGLVDFPSLREGQEVFLCWEKGEHDIEYWHSLEAGYAGRERL